MEECVREWEHRGAFSGHFSLDVLTDRCPSLCLPGLHHVRGHLKRGRIYHRRIPNAPERPRSRNPALSVSTASGHTTGTESSGVCPPGRTRRKQTTSDPLPSSSMQRRDTNKISSSGGNRECERGQSDTGVFQVSLAFAPFGWCLSLRVADVAILPASPPSVVQPITQLNPAAPSTPNPFSAVADRTNGALNRIVRARPLPLPIDTSSIRERGPVPPTIVIPTESNRAFLLPSQSSLSRLSLSLE